jgi:signal transduction histidine kinase/CheY-like chemotaxis protein
MLHEPRPEPLPAGPSAPEAAGAVEPPRGRPAAKPLGFVAAVTALHLAAAVLAIALTRESGNVAAIWPANAILLAALLHPRRPAGWLPLAAATGGAGAAANLVLGSPLVVAVGLAACNMGEVLLAAAMLRRRGGFDPASLLGLAGLVRFAAIAGVAAPALAATAGAAIVTLAQGTPFGTVWRTWYVGDALGLLAVTPFLLSWASPALHPRWSRRLVLELALLVGLLLLVTALAFGQQRLPAMFATFPLLLLAAWRGGLPGASTAAVALGVPAIWLTVHGQEPMALVSGAGTIEQLQNLQLYLAMVLLSTLPVAAALAERQWLGRHLAEARRAAAAAGQAKDQFLAVMSHEIRTPMTAMLGMADLLTGTPLDARQRRHVAQIRDSGRRLLALVDAILDFVRLGSDGFRLEEADFDPAQLARSVQATMQAEAARKGLAFELRLDPERPPTLRGDQRRLEQVLLELLTNAVKFTERGGIVLAVAVAPADADRARLACSIRDDGIGLSEADAARLFQPFVQAETGAARRFGGTGLGLALCRRLIDAMGGTIGVQSRPGEGSTFRFEVILALGGVVTDAARASPGLQDLPPLRVLVADDAPLNRELLHDMLARHGHTVVLAENGCQLLERAGGERFDLLLLDIQMPVMDGEEAIRRLRAGSGPNQATPAIALTANVVEADRRRYLEAGMDRCLSKPIVWAKLSDAIAALIGAGAGEVRTPTAAVASAPIDWGFVAEVFAGMPAGDRDRYLERALAEASLSLEELRACGGDHAETGRLAHRLKGMARSFGLAAIGAGAEAIERGATAGLDRSEPLAALGRAIAATRAALGGGPSMVPASALPPTSGKDMP